MSSIRSILYLSINPNPLILTVIQQNRLQPPLQSTHPVNPSNIISLYPLLYYSPFISYPLIHSIFLFRPESSFSPYPYSLLQPFPYPLFLPNRHLQALVSFLSYSLFSPYSTFSPLLPIQCIPLSILISLFSTPLSVLISLFSTPLSGLSPLSGLISYSLLHPYQAGVLFQPLSPYSLLSLFRPYPKALTKGWIHLCNLVKL